MPPLETQPKALDRITNLIRKPIVYDEDNDCYRLPRCKNIVGTHGTHISSVVNLALYGKFVGGHASLAGNFFLNANKQYSGWNNTDLAEEMENPDYADVDTFEKAIEYAETSGVVAGYDFESYSTIDEGAVITFNNHVLVPGTSLGSGNEDNAPELILPNAPPIEAIQGIYPVEQNAARLLIRGLDKLR